MATRLQIKCINKNPRFDPYNAITHVGGYTDRPWKYTLQDAIRFIERGEAQFYVELNIFKQVDVIVATSRAGNKYLKTTADGDAPNNLLSLPECP